MAFGNRGGSGGGGRGGREKRDLLFHKALSEMGPVRVTVDDNARYLKAKDAYVVDLTIKGEPLSYWCESEQCLNFFEGKKGRTFTLIAEGSRDKATINYVGESGETAGQHKPPPQSSAGEASAPARTQQAPAEAARTQAAPAATIQARQEPQAPPPRDATDRLIEGLRAAGQFGVAVRVCAKALHDATVAFAEGVSGAAASDELKRSLADNIIEQMCTGETLRSMLIGMERTGGLRWLPGKLTKADLDAVHTRIEQRKAAKASAAQKAAAEAAKRAEAARKAAEEAAAKAAQHQAPAGGGAAAEPGPDEPDDVPL